MAFLLGSSGWAGDAGASSTAVSRRDIFDTAVAAGAFKTLVAAVEAAGLVETLQGPGPFTVLAPSDQAFAKLPTRSVRALLEDKEALAKVLRYHVLPGKVPYYKAASMRWAETAQGQSLLVRLKDQTLRFDGARVVAADIPASNGIIHVIDTVLMPRKDLIRTAMDRGSFDTLVAALRTARLDERLRSGGPFTVFAPADSAFANLPEKTIRGLLKDDAKLKTALTYHVVAGRILTEDIDAGSSRVRTVSGLDLRVERKGQAITVNDARVESKDIVAGNGVIHVVDSVLLPAQR
jgi:uncharacterized surface protein with fasciclin (FAS1) repeats